MTVPYQGLYERAEQTRREREAARAADSPAGPPEAAHGAPRRAGRPFADGRPFHLEDGTSYYPWHDPGTGAVGFRVIRPDGRTCYVYLTPSDDGGEAPAVTGWVGTRGLPGVDRPVHLRRAAEGVIAPLPALPPD